MHNWIAIFISTIALAFSWYTYSEISLRATDERAILVSSTMFSNAEIYDLSVDYTNYREAIANQISAPAPKKDWGYGRYIGYLEFVAKLANEKKINTKFLSNWLLCDMYDAIALFEHEKRFRRERQTPELEKFNSTTDTAGSCKKA